MEKRALIGLPRLWLGVFVVGIALLVLTTGAQARVAVTFDDMVVDQGLEGSIVAVMNTVRAGAKVRALSPSRPLTRAARQHAKSMGRDGYFSHSSANGSSFTRRLDAFYASPLVGETILWSTGDVSPEAVVTAWLDSPPHRQVLLARKWHEIGVAVIHVAHAPGVYGGRDVTIVVADFGTRP